MTVEYGTKMHEFLERATQLDNPYWNAVEPHAQFNKFYNGLQVEYSRFEGAQVHRPDLVAEYSWTITDPRTVAFVAEHAGKYVIDPMAGTGYWSKLLVNLGIDVCSYDNKSWPSHTPHDHVGVLDGDAPSVVRRFPNHTLFLAWPPYSSPVGFYTVRNYRRNLVGQQRIIYIGEGNGGCTGDDEMHEELDEYWDEIACHQPVQWWGMHDLVHVYDRRSSRD